VSCHTQSELQKRRQQQQGRSQQTSLLGVSHSSRHVPSIARHRARCPSANSAPPVQLLVRQATELTTGEWNRSIGHRSPLMRI